VVDCSTLVDLQRRMHGVQLMPDVFGGTTRSEVDTERSWRHAVLPTDNVRSDKYSGAVPFRQPYTSTHSLY